MAIVAVEQVKEGLANWRNWDVIEWFMAVMLSVLGLIFVTIILVVISGGGGERAIEGDIRTQRYDCERGWNPSTKTNTERCAWETIEYNGRGSNDA